MNYGGVDAADTHHPQVNVDEEPADSNDTLSEDPSFTDTHSIQSYIFDYEYENGRRYHAYRAGQYLLPNDDQEQERLDIGHHVFRLILGGELCMTQLHKPRRILDVGTGTGIWAIDMGDLHPNAEVIGTDLSPIQTTSVPPNVRFEIDDARDDWAYPPRHFDFIHARTLGGSILDWPAFLQKCFNALVPGGKLEITEARTNFWYAHDSVSPHSYTYQWLMEWRRLSAKWQFDIFPALRGMVAALPFRNICTVEKLLPLGTWPRDKALKTVGAIFRYQFVEMGLEAHTLALFTRAGEWSELEVQILLAKVREEIKQGKMHLYTFVSIITAEKPQDVNMM